MDKQIKKICILGGGSAGYMAASALLSNLGSQCEIILVESSQIGIVGVGEATIPPVKLFNQMLGINEADFLKATQGSIKLGIQFVDWGAIGESYFHPFGTYGADFDNIPLYQYWLKSFQNGNAKPLDDYSFAWALARENRFAHPIADKRLVQSTFDYAYHFDAGLFAQYLAKTSIARGLKTIDGKLAKVHLDGETGFIKSIELEAGKIIEADFFIDCSGFNSLLLGGALNIGFEDWLNHLPCDRAIAVPCNHANSQITPYTRSTAHKAGWQWRIPLQHRIGNGIVYSSEFMKSEEAVEILLSKLDTKPNSEPREIKFKAGHRKQFWHKNCVAIGLSAGFLEPLESTALHLVQTTINRLLALFPNKDFDETAICEFNRITIEEYERIRDFIILHYNATRRDDSDFWKFIAQNPIPDSLKYKIENFKQGARLVSMGPELFQNTSWLAVYIGQGIFPNYPDPLLSFRNLKQAEAKLESLRETMKATAPNAMLHDLFLSQIIKHASV